MSVNFSKLKWFDVRIAFIFIFFFFDFLETLLWRGSQSVRWTQEQRLGVGVNNNFIYKHEQLLGTVNMKHKLWVSEARGCEHGL